jgi:hypothetical protein
MRRVSSINQAQRFQAVMAGLVPAIHALWANAVSKAWMPGTRPGMTTAR